MSSGIQLHLRQEQVIDGRPAAVAAAERTMHDRGVRSNPRPIRTTAHIVDLPELAAGR